MFSTAQECSYKCVYIALYNIFWSTTYYLQLKGWFAKPVISILSDLRKRGLSTRKGSPNISGYLNTEFNRYIDVENGGKTFWNIWPIFCLLFITEKLFIFKIPYILYGQKPLCTKNWKCFHSHSSLSSQAHKNNCYFEQRPPFLVLCCQCKQRSHMTWLWHLIGSLRFAWTSLILLKNHIGDDGFWKQTEVFLFDYLG